MKVNRKRGRVVPVKDVPPGELFDFQGLAYARVNLGVHRLGGHDDEWAVRLTDGLLTCFGPDVAVALVEGEFTEL